MVDVFLICVIVIGFFLLSVIGLYLVIKYQHPDDKNDAYIPKLVVLFGFVLAGGTVFLLPLDVANNSNFAGEWHCNEHKYIWRMEDNYGAKYNVIFAI